MFSTGIAQTTGNHCSICPQHASRVDEGLVLPFIATSAGEYQLLFDTIPEAAWIYDEATLQFTAVNDIACARYGYSRDEFLTLTPTALRIPDEREEFVQIVQHGYRGLRRTHAVQHRTASGEHLFVDVVSRPIVVGDRPMRLVIATDVTRRLREEKSRELIGTISDLLTTSVTDDVGLPEIATAIVASLADWCCIHLRDRDGSPFCAAMNHRDHDVLQRMKDMTASQPDWLAHYAFVERVMQSGDALIIPPDPPDEGRQHQSSTSGDIAGLLLPMSLVSVPLDARGGRLGVLTAALAATGRTFDDVDQHLLQDIARRVATAIENERLYHDAQQAAREATAAAKRIQLLADASQAFTKCGLDLDDAFQTITRRIAEDIGDGCMLRLLSDDRSWLRPVAWHHRRPETLERFTSSGLLEPLSAVSGPPAQVISGREPILAERVHNELADDSYVSMLFKTQVHSWAGIPLRSGGDVVGVLSVIRDESLDSLTLNDVQLLQELADRAATAIENARLLRETECALRQSDASRSLLDTLVRATPIGFAFLDTELRYVHINDSLAAMNGMSPENHIGRQFNDLYPHLATTVGSIIQDVLDSETSVLNRRASGYSHHHDQVRHISSSFFPVFDSSRQLLGVGSIVIDETERLLTEDRLTAAEQRFRSLVEHIPAITYTLTHTETGLAVYVSPQIENVLGYTPDEYAALTPDERLQTFHPDDWERLAVADSIVANGATSLRAEFRRITRDGREIWVRDESVIVTDEAGGHPYWLGVVIDISAEKTAERELDEIRQRYQRIVDNASDMIVTLDSTHRLTFVNQRFTDLCGYSMDEAIELTLHEVVHPDDLEVALEHINQCLAGYHNPKMVEFRCLRSDGEVVYVSSSASGIEHGGRTIGVQSILRDVTADKQAERELRETTDMLHAVVDGSPAAILATDINGIVTMWNPGAEALFGWTRAEVMSRTVPFIPEHLTAEGMFIRESAYHGTQTRGFQTVRQRKDGTLINVELSSAPLYGIDGAIVGGMAMYVDITDRIRAEMDVRQREERFRSLVQNGSDIIAIISDSGCIHYMSPAVERILGIPAATASGLNIIDMLHPDDRETGLLALHDISLSASTTVATDRELRVSHRDGSWRYLALHLSNHLHDPAIGGIIVNARDVTERREFEEALARQAFYDGLTGLPNRNLFLDRLNHALLHQSRRRERVALLFLDIDNFKVINDSLGHAAGDTLLRIAGQRIASCVRTTDTVARLSGDEFTILLEEIDHPSDAVEIVDRIFDALRQTVELDGREAFISASIGVAISPSEGITADVLLRDADAAMHSAKRLGRNRFEMFDPSMHARALARLDLETQLRHALQRGEFLLHFQPEINVTTGQIIGAEALIRWDRPGHGTVNPADFIPIAEETGLIVDIGRWSLREACKQAHMWRIASPDADPFIVSVNISARQFQDEALASDVARVLQETGLDPASLALEITESAMMDDVDATARTLTELAQLGVSIMIDDFGTGYSSLAYLKKFPVNFLKIDRAFIQDIDTRTDDAAIVSAMITLAHALGIRVVAEGVERSTQHMRLRMLGCDIAQGFLFFSPLAADDIAGLCFSSTT